jgi:predicted ATPase
MSIDAKTYLLSIELFRQGIESFDRYPFNLPAIRNLNRLELHPKVTFIVGENGTGKSTLLEALAVCLGLNPEGGSRNFNFSTRQSHSQLSDHLRLSRGPRRPYDCYFLRSESFYNVATEIERLDADGGGPRLIDAYGGKSLHEQSHGESFYSLFMNRFDGAGLYLMDEPEAALSPTRQMGLLTIIHDLADWESQFIIATHSPIILAYPDAWIYVLSEEGITRTAYTDTEHYIITRRFLQDPAKMLSILLAPPEGRTDLRNDPPK